MDYNTTPAKEKKTAHIFKAFICSGNKIANKQLNYQHASWVIDEMRYASKYQTHTRRPIQEISKEINI